MTAIMGVPDDVEDALKFRCDRRWCTIQLLCGVLPSANWEYRAASLFSE